ncbi:hypothetical protein GOP47_0011729 [Adiantum capillus-veneris]|uniref:Plasma membrane ATPase n=1 Tax=Adiantum capillus-veneris TaxID=13818 RepID=A0A9D4UTG4_ADICA|nr:hypothetical protein GOP47_0011729 [Adiantum capillus-veneris]
MAIALANGNHRPPDWQDFVGIVALLLVNSTLSFWEEHNASNAAAALMSSLALKTKVLRDGVWAEKSADILVPGDIISIKLGDIIPADVILMEGDPVQIDQSALTGESLSVTKRSGEKVLSGSICKQGEMEAVVFATGVQTFLGKAAHLVHLTHQVGHFQKVLKSIGNFCICSIAIGMVVEIFIMYPIQHRAYRDGINNLLVLLIGGIPIAMPTVLSVTMAIGSHSLATQGAITKRMTAIEELAAMDVLCSDKTGTLTLNQLTVDKQLIEVFEKGATKDKVIILAARASRLENQDAIDSAIIFLLPNSKEARKNITEVHFLPFNPIIKRTAITYIDEDDRWFRASKGAPEQILGLCSDQEEINHHFHSVIQNYAGRGFRSLAVAWQEIPGKTLDGDGGPWQFCGIIPLFDPPRHDSAETIRRALSLGINVKMLTGDQLAIAKETGRMLGMGVNMYPSSLLAKNNVDGIPLDDLIENADGFAGVFPEHKFEIVKRLQERKHIIGMTGDGVNDAPALKKADIGIAVAGATDAARSASDIVLTEPGLSVIISAVLTSRAIFQRMKNYTVYAVSITVRIVVGFLLLALIWKFDFSPFMILIIAILNDGTIMTISKDRVKPSQMPDSWKLKEIFAAGIVLGVYLALMTVLFFWAAYRTRFFERTFHVRSIRESTSQLTSAIYLQVSIISQALIFVTRSNGWSFKERPGVLLGIAFVTAQLIATFVAVYARWSFANVEGIGWKWAGVIWLYSVMTYIPLDILKFSIVYILKGNPWKFLTEKAAFTSKVNYTKEVLREPSTSGKSRNIMIDKSQSMGASRMIQQARWRADIARLQELSS